MTKSKFIKLSGWAFIVGSFAFVTILSGSIAGSIISSILLAIGMLGLRALYGEKVGGIGKNILLVSIVGMVLANVAIPILGAAELGGYFPSPVRLYYLLVLQCLVWLHWAGNLYLRQIGCRLSLESGIQSYTFPSFFTLL